MPQLCQAARSAASTFGGVNGTERSRTPVASNTALAIADGTTAAAGSPAAPRLFGRPVDQVDRGLPAPRERSGSDSSPNRGWSPRAVERQLLLQGPAHRLHDVAFDLVAHAVGIDDLPAIVRT